jgi:hypothetical protein
MRRSRHITVSALFLLTIVASAARADPARISSGYLGLGAPFGVDLGFAGNGFIYVGEGVGDAIFLTDALCLTCSPIRTLSPVHVMFSPGEVFDTSSNSSCPGCTYAGDLFLHAPSLEVTSSRNHAPFTMTGTFAGFRPGETIPFFQNEVFGQGLLFASKASTGGPREEFLLYQFSDSAPVPEPGTLILAGTALTALLLRARRARWVGGCAYQKVDLPVSAHSRARVTTLAAPEACVASSFGTARTK